MKNQPRLIQISSAFILSSKNGSVSLNSERQCFVTPVKRSGSSPRSFPVSSFVGLARRFGDTRPVAHARPGKDPRVTLAVVVELVRGGEEISAAGKARAFDRRA